MPTFNGFWQFVQQLRGEVDVQDVRISNNRGHADFPAESEDEVVLAGDWVEKDSDTIASDVETHLRFAAGDMADIFFTLPSSTDESAARSRVNGLVSGAGLKPVELQDVGGRGGKHLWRLRIQLAE